MANDSKNGNTETNTETETNTNTNISPSIDGKDICAQESAAGTPTVSQ